MNSRTTLAPRRDPLITLVVSMYGVEPYLPAFLKSLDAQGEALEIAEILFVDDGSPDRSAQIVAAWLRRRRYDARIIRKENGGLSSARNVGLQSASGVWISFPDPDDVLDPDYLRVITESLLLAADDTTAVAANIIYLDDPHGRLRDGHPLRRVFARGARRVDLIDEPHAVKLQAASTFFRRSTIMEHRLEFDHRIRPNFEDGAFMCRYQATFERPNLLVVPGARYFYRQRADASSLVASSWSRIEKYVDLPRYGWVETLRAIADHHRAVPPFVQYIVLYDLSWYFHYDTRIHTPTRQISATVQAEFMSLVRETVAYIAPETIMGYRVSPLSLQSRMALLALRGEELPLNTVHVWRTDPHQKLALVKYYFAGARPSESFRIGATSIAPQYAKDRSVVYFGETVIRERILWLPARDGLVVSLGGRPREVRFGSPSIPQYSITEHALQTRLQSSLPAAPACAASRSATSGGWRGRLRVWLSERIRVHGAQLHRAASGRARWIKRPRATLTLLRARLPHNRRRYGNAWVFIDRDTQAQDNAEHLYRWTSQNRPEVNAWFVLRPDSPDWPRLQAEGFRLVRFGSQEHMLLLKLADHLISSHVDHYVVHPWDTRLYGKRGWTYSFLQHGVTKDDISRWLNGKPITSILVTAEVERAGFAADDTPYVLTDREVKLTGFPRHDALLAKSNAVGDSKNLILVMPTWREYLMGTASGSGNDRELAEEFATSDYVTQWASFIADDALHAYAAQHGLRVTFMPHPNLERHIGSMSIPGGVEVVTYAGSDVQDVIARAGVLVTDYSSLAFEAAYIGTPVVYFQFDRDEFFSKHPHRPGYFDYDRDGFGPTVHDAPSAAAAVIDILTGSESRGSQFAHRRETFFEFHDMGNSQRAFEAIRQSRPA